jgi:signal recognition particle receptor subunit beta
MSNHKIIFTGPVGAGKTTAICSISDVPPVLTDELATDMTKDRKPNTTVAMDYGIMNLGGSERLHLYGTPGQERFDFMWDILTEGGIGLVLLVNNARPDPFADVKFFLDAFKDFIQATHVAIGVTRMDETTYPVIDDYQSHVSDLGMIIPVFEIDARQRQDVSILIESLLYSLDPGVAI